MANKTTGQWVGAIVGAIAGWFIGDSYDGAMAGAAIGGAIGGAIDPPKGPHLFGPRLQDLSVQTSTYGANIPRIYGSCALFGNVFWIENNSLKEVEKNSGGGKGGGGPETTTYSYYATLALGLCRGPISGVRRIWAGSKLIYDAGADDIVGIMASNRAADGFRIYLGDEDQLPDPRMQAALGIANTPAYRGLAYIVFEDFALADYGNSLLGCPFKVEVMSSDVSEQYSRPTYVSDGLFTDWHSLGGLDKYGPYYPKFSGGVFSFVYGNQEYGISVDGRLLYTKLPEFLGVEWGRIGFLNELDVSYVGTGGIDGQGLGYLQIGGVSVLLRRGTDEYEFQGCAINQAEDRLYVFVTIAGVDHLNIYDEDFSLLSSQPQTVRTFPIGDIYYPSIPGGSEVFAVESNGDWMWRADVFAGQVNVWSITNGVLSNVHTFLAATTPFMGPYASTLAISAADGFCVGAGNGGNFFAFSRAKIVAAETVPLADIVSAECLSSGLLEASDIDVTDLSADVRGYKVSAVAAIRSALDPLQATWPFDAIQDGYKIKFVSRGNASVATVDISELGTVAAGEKPGIRIRHVREMDLQLPRRVQVSYYDIAREYDTGEQASERLNTEAVGINQVELAIVMTANEAAGVSETLLYLYWLERHDVDFVLPPTYNHLQPTDVITVLGSNATYILRLTAISYLPDGRMECSAKFNDVAIYAPVAIGEESHSVGGSLSYSGISALQLLDIPTINSAMNRSGILAGVSGYYPSWRGATVFRSDDGGQLWLPIQGFMSPGATAGYAINSIGAGRDDIVDAANSLSIRLYSGELSSVTDIGLYNGGNHFAYGLPGRWEIIAAKTVVEESDGSLTLTGLLRGRFGTEQYMDDHTDLDVIVLLDSSVLRFIGLSISSVNQSRLWKAVSSGDSIDTAIEVESSYTAINLKCLSPIRINGHRDLTALDWSISWTRRSRTPVEAFSGVATPIGETSESYEVEIWDSSYASLKRTITGLSSASTSYSAAQQIADFGAEQTTLYLKIYQMSSVIGRGYPLVTSITRNIPLDPFIDLLVLGLHFNGTNGSTTFTDIKGHAFTAFGNAQITTTGALYGGACGLFDGSGDYIRTPYHTDFDPGTGDFSVDIRANPTSVSVLQAIVGAYSAPSSTYGWLLYASANAELIMVFRDSAGAFYTFSTPPATLVANTWQALRWTKQGTTHRLFVEGLKKAESVLSATPYVHPAAGLIFGRWDDSGTTGRDFGGKLDDARIYRACISTGDYTPLPYQFPDT